MFVMRFVQRKQLSLICIFLRHFDVFFRSCLAYYPILDKLEIQIGPEDFGSHCMAATAEFGTKRAYLISIEFLGDKISMICLAQCVRSCSTEVSCTNDALGLWYQIEFVSFFFFLFLFLFC
jgi:hypothetical protein